MAMAVESVFPALLFVCVLCCVLAKSNEALYWNEFRNCFGIVFVLLRIGHFGQFSSCSRTVAFHHAIRDWMFVMCVFRSLSLSGRCKTHTHTTYMQLLISLLSTSFELCVLFLVFQFLWFRISAETYIYFCNHPNCKTSCNKRCMPYGMPWHDNTMCECVSVFCPFYFLFFCWHSLHFTWNEQFEATKRILIWQQTDSVIVISVRIEDVSKPIAS